MTLEEVKNSDAVFLNAADIAPILGCDANWIRRAAHDAPQLIGFPVSVMASRVKIPRKPFLAFLGEDEKGESNGQQKHF